MIDLGRKTFDKCNRKISSQLDYILPRAFLILPFIGAPTARQCFGENV